MSRQKFRSTKQISIDETSNWNKDMYFCFVTLKAETFVILTLFRESFCQILKAKKSKIKEVEIFRHKKVSIPLERQKT